MPALSRVEAIRRAFGSSTSLSYARAELSLRPKLMCLSTSRSRRTVAVDLNQPLRECRLADSGGTDEANHHAPPGATFDQRSVPCARWLRHQSRRPSSSLLNSERVWGWAGNTSLRAHPRWVS
jgi:hypothetical protein